MLCLLFIEEEGLSVDELKALIDRFNEGKTKNSFCNNSWETHY